MSENRGSHNNRKQDDNSYQYVDGIIPMVLLGVGTLVLAIFVGGIFSTFIVGIMGIGKSLSIRAILTLIVMILFCLHSSHKGEYKNLLVLIIFGRRYPIFFGEGFWFLVLPRPFINTEAFSVREITLGEKPKKDKDAKTEYESIKAQTRDDAEIDVEHAIQIGIINPIKWFNAEKPLEAINNKQLSQLRIIISLFNAGDINQVKGVIAGMLNGKTYAVQRLADGFLLKDQSSNIIVVECDSIIKEIKDEFKSEEVSFDKDKISDELRRRATEKIQKQAKGISEFKDSDDVELTEGMINENTIEIIPPETFDNEALIKEVERVGAYMNPPSIKDITPPEAIRKAGEKLQKERLERQAIQEETRTHVEQALIEIGMEAVGYKNKVNKEDKDEVLVPWDENDWKRFGDAKSEIRIRENTSQEIIIRHVGSQGGSSELGGSVVAAQAINKK